MSEDEMVPRKELLSAQNLYLSRGGPTAITFSNGGAVVDLDSTDTKAFRQTAFPRTFRPVLKNGGVYHGSFHAFGLIHGCLEVRLNHFTPGFTFRE
jgi:hypothetical protein